MTQVIDFLFDTLGKVFNTISSNWLLTMSLLIAILSLIIDLVIISKQKQ